MILLRVRGTFMICWPWESCTCTFERCLPLGFLVDFVLQQAAKWPLLPHLLQVLSSAGHHTGSVSFLFQVSFLLFPFPLLLIIQRQFVHLLRCFHRLHLSVNSFMDSCSFLQHSQGCFTWFLEKFSTKFWISAFFDDLISDGFIHAWKFTGYSLLPQTAHNWSLVPPSIFCIWRKTCRSNGTLTFGVK